ncbi:MAG: DnaB-like helicase C-terminal domain-containing protein [Arcobacteraceae bacterium]|jgi:replicative DNA helicase|nr:DnaB-like helicase C-terminal domain-containing protein [Arcobacteraceae bacterium]
MNKIIAIERAILASFFYDFTVFEDNVSLLFDSDFFESSHQEFYRTLQKLNELDLPFDEVFVVKNANKELLKEEDIVNILSANAIIHVEHYIKVLKESSKKRKLENLSLEIKKFVADENLESDFIITNINQYLENIENTHKSLYEHDASELIEKIRFEMTNKEIEKKVKFHTGLDALDKLLGGIDDGELIIIAARPSMGKTSLISNISIETLEKGYGVLIESLEMDATKVMKRLIATKSEEELQDLRNGILQNVENFNNSLEFLSSKNLIIEDESYITLYQLQTKIKRVLRKNKTIKNIFIDHTGKIKLSGKTREDIEIGYITNTLKKIAREHNIRIFLLQQLNRTVESRDNKRPILSDLKNSGNIEEDADIVLGLYRESYYKSKEGNNLESDLEEAEIIILKNRNGRLGTAKVWFEKKTSSFRNKTLIDKNNIIEFD